MQDAVASIACDPDELSALQRFRLVPSADPLLWGLYKTAMANIWTVEEVDLDSDVPQWDELLTEGDREFVRQVLAFFANVDGLVADNLAVRFMRMKNLPPAAFCFYGVQIMMENVHAELYQTMLIRYISDQVLREQLFAASATVPSIRAKAEWTAACTEDETRSEGERLVAFACVEGIFFSSSFCCIFWMRKRGLMPGLCQGNEWISRDEGLHFKFACAMLARLPESECPDRERIQTIVREAVDLECEFVRSALPVPLIGMNADAMCEYVRYVADHAARMMDCPAIYGATNPFEWMSLSAMEGKTNFFERRVTDYAKRSPGPVGDFFAEF